MRCKAGDLAIRVDGSDGAFVPKGAIVEVLEFFGEMSVVSPFLETRRVQNGWIVRYNGQTTGFTGNRLGIPDLELQPTRDQPGADESLAWTPVPTTKRLTEEEFKAAEVKWGEKV